MSRLTNALVVIAAGMGFAQVPGYTVAAITPTTIADDVNTAFDQAGTACDGFHIPGIHAPEAPVELHAGGRHFLEAIGVVGAAVEHAMDPEGARLILDTQETLNAALNDPACGKALQDIGADDDPDLRP